MDFSSTRTNHVFSNSAEDCGTEKPAIVDLLLFLCLHTGSGAGMESGDNGATPAFPNKALATRRIPGRYGVRLLFYDRDKNMVRKYTNGAENSQKGRVCLFLFAKQALREND